MDHDPTPADAAHDMTTVLRYHQRVGRFGREVRGDDVQMPDPRTEMETDGAGFETAGYVVDPDAVASAIISRLLAGRTIPPPESPHD
jgi:hypothetical protein